MSSDGPQSLRYRDAVSDEVRRDLDHLFTLGVVHYLWGALVLIAAVLFVGYIAAGAALAAHPEQGSFFPAGHVLIVIGVATFVVLAALGVVTIYSGWCLQKHRHRRFSLVVAAVNCIFVPMNTVLGVFTLMVLLRSSVREIYR